MHVSVPICKPLISSSLTEYAATAREPHTRVSSHTFGCTYIFVWNSYVRTTRHHSHMWLGCSGGCFKTEIDRSEGHGHQLSEAFLSLPWKNWGGRKGCPTLRMQCICACACLRLEYFSSTMSLVDVI
ncbi:hypothetical protein I7I53_09660 [Histoplasma capsulatum var. duboisii H88]|uniref:Uncharacterized protein n=1 Tax=Ajellomyces capsulatus (strain H88) TaxID=544711 RepID=A0A8A1LC37_AJEC8|nr:hypothetical protein I7I53_09660 [Histoplasma capsulatum var. duboisii H88]